MSRSPSPAALWLVNVGSLLLVGAMGVIDGVSGFELSMYPLFLAPIFMATWVSGRASGFFLSVLSAGVWLFAELSSGHSYTYVLIPYWNAGIRLFSFILLVWILSALKTALERESGYARRDFLTGLSNVQAFLEVMEFEFERCKRYERALSLAYMDCDSFKDINDRYGHATGNVLLKVVADEMTKNIRGSDIAARIGGDEFAILLPETEGDEAYNVVSRVHQALKSAMERRKWPVTFSFGVATFSCPAESVQEMFHQADRLMYSAKNEGKDRIRSEVLD